MLQESGQLIEMQEQSYDSETCCSRPVSQEGQVRRVQGPLLREFFRFPLPLHAGSLLLDFSRPAPVHGEMLTTLIQGSNRTCEEVPSSISVGTPHMEKSIWAPMWKRNSNKRVWKTQERILGNDKVPTPESHTALCLSGKCVRYSDFLGTWHAKYIWHGDTPVGYINAGSRLAFWTEGVHYLSVIPISTRLYHSP